MSIKSMISSNTACKISKSMIIMLFFAVIPLDAASIRIGLKSGLESFEFRSSGGFRVYSKNSDDDYTFNADCLRLKSRYGQVIVNSIRTGTDRLYIRALRGGKLKVNGATYRGAICACAYGKRSLSIVNELELEDYLKGVIPKELPSSFEDDAMKALAIVARTYALRNKGKHGKQGFDLCCTDHCQVYGGKTFETDRATRAVLGTRGLVLTYRGELITAVYHSTCGGSTSSAESVWGGKGSPYLKGVKCGYCDDAPHYNWEYRISRDRLKEILVREGKINEKDELSLDLVETDESGRVKLIRINDNMVTANWLRRVVGTVRTYSNYFRIYMQEPDYESMGNLCFEEKINRIIAKYEKKAQKEGEREVIFVGHGSGHGVGLCQWGANGMAKQGRDFMDILKWYYSGIAVERFRPDMLGAKVVKR